MADFNTLISQVDTIVKSVSKFESSSVFKYEPDITKIEGDPICIIIPSGNLNEFINVKENRRTYRFTIRVLVGRRRGDETSETIMRDLIDTLLDAFDNDETLGGDALLMKAAPSRWGYVEGVQEYRVAEIELEAITDFTTT